MHAVNELIDGIVNSSQAPSARRQDIQRELRAHIEDFVTAAENAGCDPNEIERLILAKFGDPGQIGRSFAWIYRHERRRLHAIAFVLTTLLLTSSLLLAILALQAALALGFGTSVMNVVASRHTLIEALDILATVAAYLAVTSLEKLFDTRPFAKAALLLTLIVAVFATSCAAAGLRMAFFAFGLVNGLFIRSVQSWVTPHAARLAIIVVCFPSAGLVFALLRSPISHLALASTCASWLAMGIGYQCMTHLAARVDATLLKSLAWRS